MKYILAIVLALSLSACAGGNTKELLLRDVYVVISPPKNLFYCPNVGMNEIPDPATATNQVVADFIVKLYRYNKICKFNMNAIANYVALAEKATLTKNKK